MEDYYFEYKEGDNLYCGIVSAPTVHAAHSMIPDQLESVPWATKQAGEFVGIAMMTPSNQLQRKAEYYVNTQDSPYDNEDWAERVERSRDMQEGGDNIIEVDMD